MQSTFINGGSSSVYRIDQFVVPVEALSAFMERLHHTQHLLSSMPGCRQNLVLTRTSGSGESNVMTLVEWMDEQTFAAAKTAMQQRYATEGFDPAAFIQELGVRPDMGVYSNA